MAPSYRNNPLFLCRQIELAIEKLVVRPGGLHQRLLELRHTLLIAPADFPTCTLGSEWGAICGALAALPDCADASCEEAMIEIACSLLDFRNQLRLWLARNQSLDDADTAA